MSERLLKLNDLIRDEIGKILLKELDLADEILVTVKRAEVSPTLEHATVFVSVWPEDGAEKILKKIIGQIYHFQQLLNRRLVMRPVPKIRFEIDNSEKNLGRVVEILQKQSK